MATKGFGGRKIVEAVRIQTNNKTQPELTVTITGEVEKFADVNPARIGLNGKAGEPVKAQVRITGTSKFPFKIVNVKASNGQNIRFHLEEVKESKIPQYILMVENTMPQKGRYVDNISLETDSKIQPVIQVPVMGSLF